MVQHVIAHSAGELLNVTELKWRQAKKRNPEKEIYWSKYFTVQ